MATPEIPEGLEELFEQTWFDYALHYGLLIGAIFQLVCIAAIVFIPAKPDEEATSVIGSSGQGPSYGGTAVEGAGDTPGGGTASGGGVSSKKGGSGGKKARKRKW